MRKAIIIAVAAALLAVSANAQTYDYVLTKGKEVSSVKWVETPAGNGKAIDIQIGDKKYNQDVDAAKKTTRWHYIYEKDKTDYEVVFSNGIYTIKGTIKGKEVNRQEKSKGYSWYQNISYKGGLALLHKDESLTYECFRPDNSSLTVMTVTNVGQEVIKGKIANHLKVTPAGMMSKLWSCHEFCDPETGILVCYRAVEGVPGTPETVWMIK